MSVAGAHRKIRMSLSPSASIATVSRLRAALPLVPAQIRQRRACPAPQTMAVFDLIQDPLTWPFNS